MSAITIGYLGIALIFVLMFLGMPIAFSFIAVGFFGVLVVKGLGPALNVMGTNPFQTMTLYAWTCVPLFIFMGYLAQYTGIAEEFYEGVRRWIGRFRGGLAHAIIVANTAFGACTGDSIGAAVTFCTVSLPEMRKYKYDDALTIGSVAAGALLSALIPPSLGFIIYGVITEISIGKLFIAGVFPGLILAALYAGVVYIWCRINPVVGPPGPRTTWREKMGAAPGMWSIALVFVVIIGGLYLGVFTPTEAGAAGAFVVLVLGLARRKLNWQKFKTAGIEAGVTVGMVAFLLVGAMVFNVFLAVTGMPMAIARAVVGLTESPLLTMVIIIAIYFILGCFLDILAIVILTVPIFFPIAINAGWDPILFGVVIVIMMMTGSITPPFGIVVYALSGAAKDIPLFRVFRGAVPFVIALFICLALVIAFPQISLFLPGTMR